MPFHSKDLLKENVNTARRIEQKAREPGNICFVSSWEEVDPIISLFSIVSARHLAEEI